MSVSSVTSLAYARATPAFKWFKLIDAVVRRLPSEDHVGEDVAETILRLLWPLQYPSTILMSYLRVALQEELMTPTILSILVIRSTSSPCSPEVLKSLCSLLLEMPLPLYPVPFPAQLEPVNLGTTASSSSPIAQQPTLGLVVPLIQTSISLLDVKVTTVVTYMVASLPPEAPPLQAALAAAEWLPALQAQGAEPLHRTLIGVLQSAGDDTGLVPPSEAQDGSAMPIVVDSLPVNYSSDPEEGGPSNLLANPVLLLVEGALIGPTLATSDGTTISPRHLEILTTGFSLTQDSQALLQHIIEASLQLVVSGKGRNDRALCFAVSGLGDLLQHWRGGFVDGRNVRAYPEATLPSTLASIVKNELLSNQVAVFDAQARERFSQLMSETDGDDDDGFLSEQSIKSLFVLVVESFVSRGMMSAIEANDIGLSETIEDNMDFSSIEESFVTRICRGNTNQVPAMVHRFLYSPTLHAAFARDVLEHMQQAHDVPPPDNLLPLLTANPVLLTVIAQYVPPTTLSQALLSETILASDDPSSRAEDPQGCLTRYGEAVILNEVIETMFQLPESFVMTEARRAHGIAALQSEERSCLNGWIKALYGADGIEDEVLLATSPITFLKLSATLVQQSIEAAVAKVIDIDTLRGGLSYFAQPLLSWCTGSVVSWLCEEIPRQGLLSAVHLDVLQTLVSSAGFPKAILKLTGRKVARLLGPGLGLEAVIQSANIDSTGLIAKIGVAGIAPERPSDAALSSPTQLRAELQVLLFPELHANQLGSLRALWLCADLWGRETATQTLLVELATSTAPSQLVQRIACAALTQRSGVLLDTAIQNFVPELLQRETMPTEAINPIAGMLIKALTIDERFTHLGQELVQQLLVLTNGEREAQRIVDERQTPITKEEIKAVVERRRDRLRAFRGVVIGSSDFLKAVPAAAALHEA